MNMKRVKQILAVIVCFALTVTTGVWAFTPSDVVGTSYESEVEMLSSLGIIKAYEDDTFRPEVPVTRAEVCTVLSRFVSYDSDLSAWVEQNRFIDVDPTHWAYNDINLLAATGIVSPADDGCFRPDDTVIYSELVKLVVSVLGYRFKADAKGGYPAGYMAVGSSLGLLSGLAGSPSAEDKVMRGPFAVIIANAMDAEVMIRTSYGEKAELTTEDGRTLLSENLGIYTERDVVVDSTYVTSLSGRELDRGYVGIGGEKYASGKTGAEKYFGQSVRVYYKTNKAGDERTIVFVKPESRNKIVSVNEKLIYAVEPSSYIEYYKSEDDSRRSTIRMKSDFSFVYNGKVDKSYTREDFMPRFGTLTAIDNNGDGTYDVVMVDDYRNIIVDTVNTDKYVISDKLGSAPITVDPNDSSLDVLYLQDGKETTMESVGDGCVLSVAKSKQDGGKSFIKIQISMIAIEGRATEVAGDRVVINGTEYELSPLLRGSIPLNEAVTYYIDFTNRVAGYDSDPTDSDLRYGYMVNAKKDTLFSDGGSIRIFTTTGEMQDYDFRNKVAFNCEPEESGASSVGTKLTGSQIYDKLDKLKVGAVEYVRPMLVKYRLDEKKQVTTLYTPIDCVSNPSYVPSDKNQLTKDAEVSGNDAKYSYSAHIFGYRYAVDELTAMFDVPSNKNDNYQNWHDPEQYEVRKLSSFAGDELYYFEAYDLNEVNWVGAAVFKQSSNETQFGKNSPAMVVKQVVTGLDADNNPVNMVIGYTQGSERTFILPDTIVYKYGSSTTSTMEIPSSSLRLKTGDFVRYVANSKNELKAVQKSFDGGSSEPYYKGVDTNGRTATAAPHVSFNQATNNDGMYQVYFGTVERKDGMLIKVKLKISDGAGGWKEDYAVFNLGRGSFYEVDLRKNTVELSNAGSISDARSGDAKTRLFIRTRGTELMDTVILNNLEEPDGWAD